MLNDLSIRSYSEIAKELGISTRQVKQLEKSALRKYERRMRQLGYCASFFHESTRDTFELAFYTDTELEQSESLDASAPK